MALVLEKQRQAALHGSLAGLANGRTQVSARDPIFKEQGCGCSSVAELLPDIHKALDLSPSTESKTKNLKPGRWQHACSPALRWEGQELEVSLGYLKNKQIKPDQQKVTSSNWINGLRITAKTLTLSE